MQRAKSEQQSEHIVFNLTKYALKKLFFYCIINLQTHRSAHFAILNFHVCFYPFIGNKWVKTN